MTTRSRIADPILRRHHRSPRTAPAHPGRPQPARPDRQQPVRRSRSSRSSGRNRRARPARPHRRPVLNRAEPRPARRHRRPTLNRRGTAAGQPVSGQPWSTPSGDALGRDPPGAGRLRPADVRCRACADPRARLPAHRPVPRAADARPGDYAPPGHAPDYGQVIRTAAIRRRRARAATPPGQPGYPPPGLPAAGRTGIRVRPAGPPPKRSNAPLVAVHPRGHAAALRRRGHRRRADRAERSRTRPRRHRVADRSPTCPTEVPDLPADLPDLPACRPACRTGPETPTDDHGDLRGDRRRPGRDRLPGEARRRPETGRKRASCRGSSPPTMNDPALVSVVAMRGGTCRGHDQLPGHGRRRGGGAERLRPGNFATASCT